MPDNRHHHSKRDASKDAKSSTDRPPKPSGSVPRTPGLAGDKFTFVKNHPATMPVIYLSSGHQLAHIRESLITHCHEKIGPISQIFLENSYRKPIIYKFDIEDMSEEKDPYGFNKDTIRNGRKQAEKENHLYEQSKLDF